MGQITLKEQTAPATPATDYHTVYVDSADGVLKKKNDAGAVSSLEPPVSSVNSQTGAVVLDSDDIGEGATNLYFTGARAKSAAVSNTITNGVTDVAPAQDAVFDALAGKQASLGFTPEDVANKDTDPLLAADSDTLYPSQKAVKAYIDAATPSGTASRLSRFDTSGDLTDISQRQVDDDGYLYSGLTAEPNGITGSFDIDRIDLTIQPLQNSPDEVWQLHQNQINFDPGLAGFNFGTTGTAFRFEINNFFHGGNSDLGAIEFFQNNFNIGNGTDPIDLRGFSYAFGFGQVNANVNINGPMQGYGYQPNVNASATIDSGAYTNAFYDGANIGCASPGHTSFSAGPNIAEITSTHNYVGLQVNPTIPIFDSNAGMVGVAVGGNLGTFGVNSYYNGVSVNPNITSARYASGINVTMDNVTVYAGVASSLVIQDLTIAADLPSSFGDTVTIEYTPGGTAGSEVVSQIGLAFTVQIDSGVSTATQVAAALNGFFGFTSNLNVTISGVGSNPQVTQAATNLAGGEDPGRKQAAYLDGDVEITGSLTFGGALSIGQLNAFASQALVTGSGNPASIHGLITQPTIAASTSVTLADTIGVNTAMLLTMGANSTVTTGFLGVAALALPAVVSMDTGATIDRVAASVFAVSLDSTAAGGAIDTLDLCRAIAIPNGVTSIAKLHGFAFDLPFGDPGTITWGFYESPGVHNFLAGDLKIGGTPGVSDTAGAGLKLHVEGDSMFDGDIGFFSTSPVAQQASSGAATAGGTYTATEQTMIQEMYDALRAYGLLT